MLRRRGEAGEPGGPFREIAVLRLSVFEDSMLDGGDARGDGRMVWRAVGACVVKIPCRGGEGTVVARLPFARAELFKIGHGDVVEGVCAHAVDHDDQRLGLKLFLCGKRRETRG